MFIRRRLRWIKRRFCGGRGSVVEFGFGGRVLEIDED